MRTVKFMKAVNWVLGGWVDVWAGCLRRVVGLGRGGRVDEIFHCFDWHDGFHWFPQVRRFK